MQSQKASISHRLSFPQQGNIDKQESFSKCRQQIMSHNYYRRLNISPSASSAQIKKAYVDLIRQTHPDKNKDNHDLCNDLSNRLNEAYQCLSDTNARRIYDLKIMNLKSSLHHDPQTDQESDSDDDFDNHCDDTSLPKDELRFKSFADLLKILDGFEEFKDDLQTLYYLRYFAVYAEPHIALKNGFDDYLASFLTVFNVDSKDIQTKDVSVMYRSALVNITLKPKACGYLTRTAYVALPLTFPFKDPDFIRLKYGEEWQGCLSFLNHPCQKIMMMRPLTAEKLPAILAALNEYLSS